MAAPTTAKELAKSKYATKVCVGYLGLSADKCERVFEKLYANMRSVFEKF